MTFRGNHLIGKHHFFYGLRVVSEGLERWLRGWERVGWSFRGLKFPTSTELPLTPVPGYLVPFSGLHGHQAHRQCTCIHGGKHSSHKKRVLFGFHIVFSLPQPLFRVLTGKLGLEIRRRCWWFFISVVSLPIFPGRNWLYSHLCGNAGNCFLSS